MGGGKHLLLLPVLVFLVRCQKTPNVFVSPPLKQIFVGDLFYLRCNTSSNEGTVKWYLNGTSLSWTNKTMRIATAAPSNSGRYQCESSGTKSEHFNINILEYLPIASLTIETGHPVMRSGASVILKIENEDGLIGWRCWVFRGNTRRRIVLRLKDSDVSLSFQPSPLSVPETVFWCTDKSEEHRSNQIIIRTSDKEGALEMYPLPAVVGESLTLRCLVWGTEKDNVKAVFYKDNRLLMTVSGPEYKINDVKVSEVGNYKCNASYKYSSQTVATPHQLVSDTQEVLVQVRPVRAVVSDGVSCSCPSCGSGMAYRYYKKEGESWTPLGAFRWPDSSGTYHCRAVLGNMKTLPSTSFDYQPTQSMLAIWITLAIVGFFILVVALCYYKKRSTSGQIYEDVALRLQGDDKYDTLQPHVREAEYDTLNPSASGGQEKGGEYEALNKKEMKDGVYDTLEAPGAEGGDGGYEALKKDRMDGGEYQTLETKSALKKDEKDGGEYQTLDKSALKKDEGEYQTLETKSAPKKDEKDGGEYQTLDKSALKEGTDEGDYQTLETKVAVGGAGKDK